MKRLRMTEDARFTTVYFHTASVRDSASAARWIAGAAALAEMQGRYIALRDLSHSADEGRADVQLDPTADSAELFTALKSGHYDRLFLAGTFSSTRVGLGVDLNAYELAITVPAGQSALAETIMEQTGRLL